MVKSHDETYPLRLKYRDVEPRKKIVAQEAMRIFNEYVEETYGTLPPGSLKYVKRELEEIL